MKNKFRKTDFLKIRKPHEKYQWWCPNIARRSPDESGKKSKSWIFEVRTLWDVYGCYMYALETWYVLYGHAICLLGIEYAVWTCYMSSGDGICCMDMLYAFWRCNMLYGHGICLLEMEYAVWTWYMLSWHEIYFLDMEYIFLIWCKMIWYDMILYDAV